MRRPRYIDLRCDNCGHEEERLLETNEDGDLIDYTETRCGAPIDLGTAAAGFKARYGLSDADLRCDQYMTIIPTMKIGDVLGRTKYPVEEDVVRV